MRVGSLSLARGALWVKSRFAKPCVFEISNAVHADLLPSLDRSRKIFSSSALLLHLLLIFYESSNLLHLIIMFYLFLSSTALDLVLVRLRSSQGTIPRADHQ